MVGMECEQCFVYIWTPYGAFMERTKLDTNFWEKGTKAIVLEIFMPVTMCHIYFRRNMTINRVP